VALRGLGLAALLGPTGFGMWALFRVVLRFASFASLGIYRGLELEVAQARSADGRTSGEGEQFARAALGFTLSVFGALSLIALAGSMLVTDPWLVLGMRVLAVVLVARHVVTYGLTYIRASGNLRRIALTELVSASLHLALAVSLAFFWQLAGAWVGFILAVFLTLSLVVRRVPLRPTLSRVLLRRLLGVGFPVALTGILGAALASADRLVVGAYGGVTLLGYYAFAVSISGLAAFLGMVIRTVVFPAVYHSAREEGAPTALRDHLSRTILPFAWVYAPVLGVAALAMGPAVSIVMPGYVEAVPAGRIIIFAGVTAGLATLGSVGMVAAGRQRILPAFAATMLVANITFSLLALKYGLGLEGVAAGSLVSRAAVGMAMLTVLAIAAGLDRPARLVMRAVLPLLWCAASVFVLGRWLPGTDLRSAALSLGLYLVLIAPLLPGVVRELRAARGAAG